MALEAKRLSPIYERYLAAYIDLAVEQKSLPNIEEDATKLQSLFDVQAFSELISNPLYRNNSIQKTLLKVLDLAEISDLTKKFIMILNENSRLQGLPEMVAFLPKEIAKIRKMPIVELVSAQQLNDAQVEKLKKDLKEKLASEIFLEVSVDPKLIAGLVVKIGSHMLDTSLKSKLNIVQSQMKGIG